MASAAEPSSTEVHWTAPAECPTERAVRQWVENALGQPIETEREQALSLSAQVTRTPDDRYVLVLSTSSRSGTGRRQLSDRQCHKLAAAAALVMALSIDPARTEKLARERNVAAETGESTSEPKADPRQTPRAALPAAADDRPAKVPTGGEISRVPTPFVMVRTLVGAGILPKVHAGASLGIGLRLGHDFELRAVGQGWLPRSAPVGETGGTIRMSLWSIGLDACWRPTQRSVWPYACVGEAIGRMQGLGTGLEQAHTERATWAATLGELGVSYRLGAGLNALGSVVGGISNLRPRFGVLDSGTSNLIFQPSLVFLYLTLGVAAEWP